MVLLRYFSILEYSLLAGAGSWCDEAGEVCSGSERVNHIASIFSRTDACCGETTAHIVHLNLFDLPAASTVLSLMLVSVCDFKSV